MKGPIAMGAAVWLVLGAAVVSRAEVRHGEPGTFGDDHSVEKLTSPRLISRERPGFPGRAARAGIWNATVLVNVIIHLDGSVEPLDILECSDSGVGFEKEAVRTLANWRFAPAFADGRPVEVYQIITVRFHREGRTFAI
ncbi:MAG TPA: energy transducer TonB [Candidatus Polarisedimenticolia bacterium]|nr:energy transducer TonB [Candidatus Polarisedimenticolia bacterium]